MALPRVRYRFARPVGTSISFQCSLSMLNRPPLQARKSPHRFWPILGEALEDDISAEASGCACEAKLIRRHLVFPLSVVPYSRL